MYGSRQLYTQLLYLTFLVDAARSRKMLERDNRDKVRRNEAARAVVELDAGTKQVLDSILQTMSKDFLQASKYSWIEKDVFGKVFRV